MGQLVVTDIDLLKVTFARPTLRSTMVARPRLLERLRPDERTTVVVAAPPGYGKTTLVAQWADQEARAVGWLSLSQRDDAPTELVTHLARVLHALDVLDETTLASLVLSQADVLSMRLPRLCEIVASTSRQFALVLDDAENVTGTGSVEVLRALAESIPARSKLALSTRSTESLLLARLEAGGRVHRTDTADLALTGPEGAELLQRLGLDLQPDIVAALVEHAEGWPAGLALAALAVSQQADPSAAAEWFAGDDRLVADYFREEVVRRLPYDERAFLTRSSILGRLSGPRCDAVLQRSGSAQMLEHLARSNLFVVPLDRWSEWYRFHQLFREMLTAELRLHEPEIIPELHARASEWCAGHGDPDGAIEHAYAAGDVARASALVWEDAPRLLELGRTSAVTHWVELFRPDEIAREPALVVTEAWRSVVVGSVPSVPEWVSIAERTNRQLPDGTPLRAAVALLHGLIGAEGLSRMRTDAALAYDLAPAGSAFRAVASHLEGAACRLLGDAATARRRLEEGIRLSGATHLATRVHCGLQLALLALDADDWDEAHALIRMARAVIDECHFEELPAMAGVYAAEAMCLARRGASAGARTAHQHAVWLLEMMTGIGRWSVVESTLHCARTSLLLGEVATARMLVRDAQRILGPYPDPGSLPTRLDAVQLMTDVALVPVGVTATPLTPAEMRVLRYLPTHLSFDAIATELFVSRNTVKTQAIAVYRKLGESSRAAAVCRARELGLLEGAHVTQH